MYVGIKAFMAITKKLTYVGIYDLLELLKLIYTSTHMVYNTHIHTYGL